LKGAINSKTNLMLNSDSQIPSCTLPLSMMTCPHEESVPTLRTKKRHGEKERWTISCKSSGNLRGPLPPSLPLRLASLLLVLSGCRINYHKQFMTSEALASPTNHYLGSRLFGSRSRPHRSAVPGLVPSPGLWTGINISGGSINGEFGNNKLRKKNKTECNVLRSDGINGEECDDSQLDLENSSGENLDTDSGSSESFDSEEMETIKEKHMRSFPRDIPTDQLLPCNYVAECNLPTLIGDYRLRAYRISDSVESFLRDNRYIGNEPCVIYSTGKRPFNTDGSMIEGVPVRIHDQCFTSEVFRSERCDCKQQLMLSLEYIQEHGGAVIYLQQEGRGIGLANKVAAYALQDLGFDTVDANTHLGFPEDCRQYGTIPSILNDMNIGSIKLITNNPRKIKILKSLGVKISDTIPMVIGKPSAHNLKYLQTKQDRMNHMNFGDMLGSFDSAASPEIISKTIQKAQKDINDDGEITAEAIAAVLEGTSLITIKQDTAAVIDEHIGVTAASDGYCFGRQSVVDAIGAMSKGEIVVVVDDMERENEGDFIMAAGLCTPEKMATIVRYSSGVICVGMEGKALDKLNLPSMVVNNEDPKNTAFSVTVDAKFGITTGISAFDRARTINLLASGSSVAEDFSRPGHIFPLRAKEGGVLTRDGHTEAAVDMARLAGCEPAGVLCEIVSEEHPTEMARLPELKRFCKKHGFVMTSIVDLAQYRRELAFNSAKVVEM